MTDIGFAALQQIVANEFDISPASITRETTAEDVDGWDSVSHASLIMAVEKAFNVVFPDDDIYTMENVGAIHDKIVELSR